MEMKYSKWDNEEIKTLFKFVEIKKSEGMALINIFKEYANKTFRHQNSVRNYYYKELNCLINNKDRAYNLGIDLNIHDITKATAFSQDETLKVIKDIDELLDKGYSVRRACLTLANGDVNKMIRYQNKYRSVKIDNNKHNNKGVNMGEIIKMPQPKNSLGDDDIKALFLGLLKLVKKQEYDKAKNELNKEMNYANQKLSQAVAEITVKQNKIVQLQKEIFVLKQKIQEKDTLLLQDKITINKSKAGKLIQKFFNQEQNSTSVNIK